MEYAYELRGLRRRFAEAVHDLAVLQVEHGRLQEFHDGLLEEYEQMLSRLETAQSLLSVTEVISPECVRELIRFAIEGIPGSTHKTASQHEEKGPHITFLDEECVCDW